jgi:hypothetical protein
LANCPTFETLDQLVSEGVDAVTIAAPTHLHHELALASIARNPFEFWRLEGRARAYHVMGRDRESRAALDELVARYAFSAAYQVAQVHAVRGEADAAFEWLERARVQHDAGLQFFRWDAAFRGLHGDPRWKPFLETMGVPPD